MAKTPKWMRLKDVGGEESFRQLYYVAVDVSALDLTPAKQKALTEAAEMFSLEYEFSFGQDRRFGQGSFFVVMLRTPAQRPAVSKALSAFGPVFFWSSGAN